MFREGAMGDKKRRREIGKRETLGREKRVREK